MDSLDDTASLLHRLVFFVRYCSGQRLRSQLVFQPLTESMALNVTIPLDRLEGKMLGVLRLFHSRKALASDNRYGVFQFAD